MGDVHLGARKSLLERTCAQLLAAMERAQRADTLARERGLLQAIDPRVKLAGILLLIAAVAMARNLEVMIAIFALASLAALGSGLGWRDFWTAWLAAFFFTGILGLPALFITPGDYVVIFRKTGGGITRQGLQTAAYLLARAEATVTLTSLLILTTSWPALLRAMRSLRMPAVFVVISGMAYRYIFLLLETARDMYEARRGRIVGPLGTAERRRLILSSMGVLLGKTFHLSNEVYMAMQSRGFRGEIYLLEEARMTAADWLALGCFTAAAAMAVALGR